MATKIDRKWLEKNHACPDGKEWFVSQGVTEPIAGLKNLIKHDKLDWANWLIVRVMDRQKYLAYTIYAAKKVINIFEKKYPKDDRPRKAIEAAEAVLEKDSPDRRSAAAAASAASYASAASAAASAASYAASASAAAASYAAAAAASAASYASAAYAAAYAASAASAAYADSSAASVATRRKIKLLILKYGISLLEKSK